MDRVLDSIRGESTWDSWTSSLTSASTSTQSANPQISLDNQYQQLSEQTVLLKFEIATRKRENDKLNLDLHKLHVEKVNIEQEIESIEVECKLTRNKTGQTRKECSEGMEKLKQMKLDVAHEMAASISIKSDYDSAVAGLIAVQEEFNQINSERESLNREIHRLKLAGTQILSDRGKIESEANEIDVDIMINLKADMNSLSTSESHSTSSTYSSSFLSLIWKHTNMTKETTPSETQKLRTRLAQIRKKNAAVCRQNKKIERIIVAKTRRQSG